jgi:hypothetical protein
MFRCIAINVLWNKIPIIAYCDHRNITSTNVNSAVEDQSIISQELNELKGIERYIAYGRNYSRIGKTLYKLRKLAPKNGKYFAQHSSEFGEVVSPYYSEKMIFFASG